MTNLRPTINVILERFFSARLEGTKGLTRERIETVERHLRACIEAEAEHILVDSDRRLLAAERQFDPAGAVGRVMHADDLVFILSIFVEAPWLPDDPVQRQRQLQLTDALTGHLLGRRLVDRDEVICPLLDIRAGIDRDRRERRRVRATRQ